jgi:quercetin dioxygenase-like cupin family protein
MRRVYRCAFACVASGILVSASSVAQDRKTVDPRMQVLFENECVRVQFHDVAVGQSVPMHSHPSYLVYTMKPFKARITLPDGIQRISEHPGGVAYWNEPISHSVENLGTEDIHNLIVEMKPDAPESCRRAAEAPKR